MRISDWSSDVCSSDLPRVKPEGDDESRWHRCCVRLHSPPARLPPRLRQDHIHRDVVRLRADRRNRAAAVADADLQRWAVRCRRAQLRQGAVEEAAARSEEHTSELQSLMRISYAVFCSKQKKTH